MAGYTTITVKGQEIGLRFGLPAIKQISDKINLLSGSDEIVINLMSSVHILYAGYVNNCLANDNAIELSFKLFYEFVEEAAINNNMDEVRKAIEVFASSKEVSVKVGAEEKKSKGRSTGKRSKAFA